MSAHIRAGRRRDSSSGDDDARRRDPRPTVGTPVPEFPGFEIRGELGRGGMGVVYRAFDRRRGEIVALKSLLWGDPAALYRFKQEFRGFADLSHPNLVSLHELVSDGRAWFFTMELVEGVPFLDWVRESPERLRPALAQLLEGLAALHAEGRVHRDVKPSNVLVTPDGRVVLLDFGLAAELSADGLYRSTKTHVLGTVAYMSPEQASGRPVSSASDLYSLGVMLFEALTGRLPFEGDAVQMVVDKRTREAPRASRVATGVPADLDALCAELLARDPAVRPTAAAAGVRVAPTGGGSRTLVAAADRAAPMRSLVGRDEHLSRLANALAALERRRPVLALVHGASGMGKSALVQAFLDETALPRNAVVLSGRCYERESVPFKAVDSAMDALARHLARMPSRDAAALLPRDVGALTRLFPVLRRAEAVAAAPQSTEEVADPHEARRQAFEALRELFGRISDRRPLVLWADDLQWGDAESAALLAAVLQPPNPPAMLVVGSYRREDAATSPFLTAALPLLEDLAERIEIPVDPLGSGEAADLAARLTGGDVARARDIARESQGSPFYLHELAEFGASPAGGTVTLDAVVADRVERLQPDARRVLEAVAVSGGPLPQRAALKSADVDATARAALAALRAGRLVRVTGTSDAEELDTYHDRVREAVLARMPNDVLRDNHRRLALALELSGSSDAEKLGVHFEGGGDAVRAAAHYERAADAAAGSLAFAHAARLYRQALDLASPSGDSRGSLLVKRADALRDARRAAEAAAVYLEAAADAPRDVAFDLRQRAGEQLFTGGRIDEGLEILRDLLRNVGTRMPRSEFAAMTGIFLNLTWLRIRGYGFRRRRAEDVPADLLRRHEIFANFGITLSHADCFSGVYFMSRAVILALQIGDPTRVAQALDFRRSLGIVIFGPREAPALRRRMRRSLEATRDVTDLQTLGMRHLCDGFLAFHAGRWRSCWTSMAEADRMYRRVRRGAAYELQIIGLYSGFALDFLGEFERLERRTDEMIREAAERDDRYSASSARSRLVPVVHLLHDAPDAASAAIERAAREWSRRADIHQLWRVETGGAERLYSGDFAGALSLAESNWAGLERAQITRIPMPRAVLLYLRGRSSVGLAAEAGAGRRRDLLRRAQRHAAAIARVEVTCARPWAELVRAGVAAVEGRTEEAIARLEDAERGLREIEMPAFEAPCLRRRGELIGGEEGRALVEEADAKLRALGVANPERWADAYVPRLPA